MHDLKWVFKSFCRYFGCHISLGTTVASPSSGLGSFRVRLGFEFEFCFGFCFCFHLRVRHVEQFPRLIGESIKRQLTFVLTPLLHCAHLSLLVASSSCDSLFNLSTNVKRSKTIKNSLWERPMKYETLALFCQLPE